MYVYYALIYPVLVLQNAVALSGNVHRKYEKSVVI